MFYRGGGIVPRRERPRRSTATMARDPFTLIVALDQDGNAHGDLYVDDGRSLAFKKGHYLHRWVWGEVLFLRSSWQLPLYKSSSA